MDTLQTFINATPHPVVFYKDGKEYLTIPPSKEHALRMKTETHQLPSVDGVPVISAPRFTDVDGDMPDGPILVSMPVGQFLAAKRKNVYGPDTDKGAVRDDKGRIIGTTGLILY